jgi:hypothetical protein
MSIEDEPEDEGYEPIPERILDGEVLLADPWEFFDVTDSLAAIVRDGALFVLKRDGRWINVEDALKPKRDATVMQAVRTKQ